MRGRSSSERTLERAVGSLHLLPPPVPQGYLPSLQAQPGRLSGPIRRVCFASYSGLVSDSCLKKLESGVKQLFVQRLLKVAFAPTLCQGRGPVMGPVRHTWGTNRTEALWGQLSSLHGWEREWGTAVSKVGEEGAKKRAAGPASLPGFRFTILTVPAVWDG